MRDRMPPEKLARAKGQAATTNRAVDLARKTLSGDGKAADDLTREFGAREARRMVETEIVKSGGKPKGILSKIFGS